MSGKIITRAVFQSKAANFEADECIVEKVIRLSGAEFDRFTANMLKDQDFIRDNKDLMRHGADGTHCLLVVGEGRRDGVLINSEGYDYARYTGFLPNAEEFLTAVRYPSLAEFNRKAAAVVDFVDGCIDDGVKKIGFEEFRQMFGMRADRRILDVVADILDERFGGVGMRIDDGNIWFGEDTALIVSDKPLENGAVIAVEIVNRADPGDWAVVSLPASHADLKAAFGEIGVDGAEDRPYRIIDITSPVKEVVTRLSGRNNLDELNMLATYLRDSEDFELENFKAILESGLGNIPQNAAGLINLLYEDNLTSFDVIDAHNDEQLGLYWDEERPERLSPEAYGRMVRNEEGGAFTAHGYVHVKFNDFTEFYNGVVPEEHRIVDAALRGLRAKATGRGDAELVPAELVSASPQSLQPAAKPTAERADGYTSVLDAIDRGKKAQKPPRKTKAADKNHRKDGGSL